MNSVFRLGLLLALSGACFGSFAWAVARHFRRDGPLSAGMRLLSAASLAGFAWLVLALATSPPAPGWRLSLGLQAGALGLFWWTIRTTRARPQALAFSGEPPTWLRRDGPYRYVRHPFYGSYLLFWAGGAVATRSLAYWAVPAVMLLLYFAAARAEERGFARSPLGGAYAEYRTSAGMLLPRPHAVVASLRDALRRLRARWA